MIKKLIRKIVEKLYWKYQEEDNWRMKMNEPIVMHPISKEELEALLKKKREKVANAKSV